MRKGSLLLLVVAAAGLLAYGLWRSVRTPQPAAPFGAADDTPEKRKAPALEVPALPTGRVAVGTGGGQIRGLVQDEGEMPVGGVTVAILEQIRVPHLSGKGPWLVESAARPAIAIARLRTDAHGRFVCTGLEHDTYYAVRAEPAPPLTGGHTTALLRRDHDTDILLRVRPGCALSGRVVEHDGTGVRALVSATWRRQRFNRTVESWRVLDHATGTDGRFDLPAVPVGLLRVSVRVPGRVALSDVRVITPHKGPLTLRLGSASTARMSGRVTDSAGVGVAGAQVHAAGRRTDTQDRFSSQHIGVADADGAYALTLPAPLLLTDFKVTADGYVDRELKSVYRPYAPGTADTIDFVLLRGAHIRGHVRTEDGKPLAGVRVQVAAGRRARRGDPEAITADDGAYDIGGLPPAEYSVRTELDGYAQKAPAAAATARGRGRWWARLLASVEVPGEGVVATVDITMLAGSPIVGRVVDGDQKPVPGARVWIGRRAKTAYPRGDSRAFYGGEGETRTDASGRFRFTRRADGKDYFVVATTATDLSDEVPARPTENEDPEEIVLTLVRAATLAGVAQHADGSPYPFARFGLRGPVRHGGSTDRDGRFRIALLPAGQYEVSLQGPFASAAAARLLASGDVVEDVVLEAPQFHSISGVLVGGDGKPLSDTRVTLERKRERGGSRSVAHTTTDAEGRFHAEVLMPGTYHARIGGVILEHTVEAGASGVRFVHVPLPWTQVRGTVLDPAGEPVASGTVYVGYPSPRGEGKTGRSAPILGGTFRIGIQTHGDTVDLRVQDPRDIRGAAIDVAPRQWNDLAIADAPFELRLQAGGVVAGLVVDADGQGVSGAQVEARHGDPRGPRGRRQDGGTAITGADGRFRFEGLKPGTVLLTLRPPPEYLPVPEQSVETGATDVRFELRRGGFVAGRVLEADGSPAANVPVQAEPRNHPVGPWGQGTTAADGTFRLVGLDPSIEYRVRTNFDHRRGGRKDLLRIPSAWVRAGTTGIEIRLIKGVFIKGRVLAPDGKPSAGGFVIARSTDPAKRAEGGSMARLDNAEGTFSLGPLPPGRYEVTAQTQDPAHGPSEPVVVAAPAVDVVLRYTSRLTRVGVVHGDDVEHFRIVWWAQKADGSLVMGHGGADKDGRFTIGQMADLAGTVFVYRRKDGRCAWIEDVRPSDKALDVRLTEGLTITGRVELSSPAPKKWKGMTMVIAHLKGIHPFNLRSSLDAEGNFAIRGLPKGTYVVRYHAMAQEGPAVEVEAGATGVVLRDK